MKISRTALYLVLMASVVMVFAPDPASAQPCKAEAVKLKVHRHGLRLTPDGGPKCLDVSDLASVNATFSIGLNAPQFDLEDGQVHVRRVTEKFFEGEELECGTELDFAQPEYTNVGENDIEVTVVGTNVSVGATICYEIIVDDIGSLDPRARVEQAPNLGAFNQELADLIAAFDLLVQSALGEALSSISLDDFLQEHFGVTEADARGRIEALETQTE